MTQAEILERAQREFPRSDFLRRMGDLEHRLPVSLPIVKRIVVGATISDPDVIHRRWNTDLGTHYPMTLTYSLDGEERTVTGFHVWCYWAGAEQWIDRTQFDEIGDDAVREYLSLFVYFVLELLLKIHGDKSALEMRMLFPGIRHLRALS